MLTRFIVLVLLAIQLAFILGLAEPYQSSGEAGLYGFTLEQLAVIGGALAGTLAFLISWLIVGRDPKASRISPQFQPPTNLEPAAVHYLHERTFDYRCFTATLLNMAVKGALQIVEEPAKAPSSEKTFRLEPIESVGMGLSDIELATYRAMFPVSDALTVGDKLPEGERLAAAKAELESQLKKEHYGQSFHWNGTYSLTSTAIGIASAYLLLLFLSPNLGVAHAKIEQWLIALVSSAIVTFGWAAPWILPRAYRFSMKEFLWWFGGVAVFTAIVSAIAYWLLGRAEADAHMSRDWILLGSGIIFGATITILSWHMGAPTPRGRKFLDEIDGLALYLSGGWSDRKATLGHAPQRTLGQFQQLLPYAVALDVAEEWSAQFDDVIDPMQMPDWYRGGDRFVPAELAKELSIAII